MEDGVAGLVEGGVRIGHVEDRYQIGRVGSRISPIGPE